MDNLRVPPQNLEAERAIIGSVLIDNEALSKAVDLISQEYFYDLRNGLIFEAISELYKRSVAVDILTLTSELKKNKNLKKVGGVSYLSEIVASVPTASNIEAYCNIVKEASIRRSIISFATKLDEFGREEKRELDDILNEMESTILNFSTKTTDNNFHKVSKLLEIQMQKADEYAKNPDGLRGISTGIKSVDKILGGLQKSDLIILAARPSVGKSAFAFDIGRHVAVSDKKTIAIFSLEMPAVQVIERMLAQQIDVDLWNLRMGKLTDSDYRKYSEGAGKLSESKIFIDDTPGVSITQLRSKARRLKLEHGLDLLIVDYLQLMQGNQKTDNRAQEVGEISRSLKILARELEIPVLVLSQLNRAVENRNDKIPQLSDLRESGAIEQDADVVIFLGREINQEVQETDQVVKVDLFVAKHRNGPTGRIALNFYSTKTKFKDIED